MGRRSGLLSTATALLVLLASGSAALAADVVKYYHLDGLGNVRAITDQNKAVIERHDYLPFGEECTTGPCASNPGVGAGQSRKFTGKERDAETGLDYFGARYYGSRIGRFTTVDPVYTWNDNLLDPQRWNRYAYGRNNPLRYVDPDGRAAVPRETMASFEAQFPGNASIRSAVGGLFQMENPNQSATFWAAGHGADLALSMVLPQNMQEFRANTEASLFGLAAPLEAGSRVLANRLAGTAAEVKVAQELVAEGKTILGSQVCCTGPQGRRFVDHLVKDAAGEITAVEVKSGGGVRNAAQRAKDADIAAGRATFSRNAPAEVSGQQRAVSTVERRPQN